MATINIGNLAFTHKGDYDGSTAYAKNDVVYYSSTGSAYIAKQSTTGNLPTSTAHWNVFSAGSGGIWNAGLSLGTAGQVVKVNSGGNALEFGADVGGKILQVIYAEDTTSRNTSSTNYSTFSGTASISITPAATSNKILLFGSFGYYKHASGYVLGTIQRAGTTDLHTNEGLSKTYHPSDGGDSSFMQYLDSPNTTSATTYAIRIKTPQGAQVSINHHSLLAMEISA